MARGEVNALDTFSGIGGFALGCERAGIRTVAFCEINVYCRAVLARRWPGTPCFPDIHGIDADGLGRLGFIDLVTGGVPCQPASLAGKRRGSADERWLWPAFFNVVRLSGAPWVLAENPLGIISLEPHGLHWICGTFRDLGYEPWPVIVSANDVGAPHLRKRVWIVAYSNGNFIRLNEQRRARGWDHVQDGRHAELGDHGAQEPVADASGVLAQRGSERARLDAARHRSASGDGAARGSGEETQALADAESRRNQRHGKQTGQSLQSVCGDSAKMGTADEAGWLEGPTAPDANGSGLIEGGELWSGRREPDAFGSGEIDADAGGERLERLIKAGPAAWAVDRSRHGRDTARWWWRHEPQPSMGVLADGISAELVRFDGRTARGVPERVQKLTALGNAAVPQIVEAFARAILEADRSMRS